MGRPPRMTHDQWLAQRGIASRPTAVPVPVPIPVPVPQRTPSIVVGPPGGRVPMPSAQISGSYGRPAPGPRLPGPAANGFGGPPPDFVPRFVSQTPGITLPQQTPSINAGPPRPPQPYPEWMPGQLIPQPGLPGAPGPGVPGPGLPGGPGTGAAPTTTARPPSGATIPGTDIPAFGSPPPDATQPEGAPPTDGSLPPVVLSSAPNTTAGAPQGTAANVGFTPAGVAPYGDQVLEVTGLAALDPYVQANGLTGQPLYAVIAQDGRLYGPDGQAIDFVNDSVYQPGQVIPQTQALTQTTDGTPWTTQMPDGSTWTVSSEGGVYTLMASTNPDQLTGPTIGADNMVYGQGADTATTTDTAAARQATAQNYLDEQQRMGMTPEAYVAWQNGQVTTMQNNLAYIQDEIRTRTAFQAQGGTVDPAELAALTEAAAAIERDLPNQRLYAAEASAVFNDDSRVISPAEAQTAVAVRDTGNLPDSGFSTSSVTDPLSVPLNMVHTEQGETIYRWATGTENTFEDLTSFMPSNLQTEGNFSPEMQAWFKDPANTAIIQAAYENGYTAPDGRQFEPGGRAIWELAVSFEPWWNRAAADVLFDPANFIGGVGTAGARLSSRYGLRSLSREITQEAQDAAARGLPVPAPNVSTGRVIAGRTADLVGGALQIPNRIVNAPMDAAVSAVTSQAARDFAGTRPGQRLTQLFSRTDDERYKAETTTETFANADPAAQGWRRRPAAGDPTADAGNAANPAAPGNDPAPNETAFQRRERLRQEAEQEERDRAARSPVARQPGESPVAYRMRMAEQQRRDREGLDRQIGRPVAVPGADGQRSLGSIPPVIVRTDYQAAPNEAPESIDQGGVATLTRDEGESDRDWATRRIDELLRKSPGTQDGQLPLGDLPAGQTTPAPVDSPAPVNEMVESPTSVNPSDRPDYMPEDQAYPAPDESMTGTRKRTTGTLTFDEMEERSLTYAERQTRRREEFERKKGLDALRKVGIDPAKPVDRTDISGESAKLQKHEGKMGDAPAVLDRAIRVIANDPDGNETVALRARLHAEEGVFTSPNFGRKTKAYQEGRAADVNVTWSKRDFGADGKLLPERYLSARRYLDLANAIYINADANRTSDLLDVQLKVRQGDMIAEALAEAGQLPPGWRNAWDTGAERLGGAGTATPPTPAAPDAPVIPGQTSDPNDPDLLSPEEEGRLFAAQPAAGNVDATASRRFDAQGQHVDDVADPLTAAPALTPEPTTPPPTVTPAKPLTRGQDKQLRTDANLQTMPQVTFEGNTAFNVDDELYVVQQVRLSNGDTTAYLYVRPAGSEKFAYVPRADRPEWHDLDRARAEFASAVDEGHRALPARLADDDAMWAEHQRNMAATRSGSAVPEAAPPPMLTVDTPQGPQGVIPGLGDAGRPMFGGAPAAAAPAPSEAQRPTITLGQQAEPGAEGRLAEQGQMNAGQRGMFGGLGNGMNTPAPAPDLAPAQGMGRMSPQAISTDEARFQPRLKDSRGTRGLDESRVGRILQQGWDDQKQQAITVWRDPADGKMYVIDGHHRLEAARRANRDTIKVDVFEGDEQAARNWARDNADNRAETLAGSTSDRARAHFEAALAGGTDYDGAVGATSTAMTGFSREKVKRFIDIGYLPEELHMALNQNALSETVAGVLGQAIRNKWLTDSQATNFFMRRQNQKAMNGAGKMTSKDISKATADEFVRTMREETRKAQESNNQGLLSLLGGGMDLGGPQADQLADALDAHVTKLTAARARLAELNAAKKANEKLGLTYDEAKAAQIGAEITRDVEAFARQRDEIVASMVKRGFTAYSTIDFGLTAAAIEGGRKVRQVLRSPSGWAARVAQEAHTGQSIWERTHAEAANRALDAPLLIPDPDGLDGVLLTPDQLTWLNERMAPAIGTDAAPQVGRRGRRAPNRQRIEADGTITELPATLGIESANGGETRWQRLRRYWIENEAAGLSEDRAVNDALTRLRNDLYKERSGKNWDDFTERSVLGKINTLMLRLSLYNPLKIPFRIVQDLAGSTAQITAALGAEDAAKSASFRYFRTAYQLKRNSVEESTAFMSTPGGRYLSGFEQTGQWAPDVTGIGISDIDRATGDRMLNTAAAEAQKRRDDANRRTTRSTLGRHVFGPTADLIKSVDRTAIGWVSDVVNGSGAAHRMRLYEARYRRGVPVIEASLKERYGRTGEWGFQVNPDMIEQATINARLASTTGGSYSPQNLRAALVAQGELLNVDSATGLPDPRRSRAIARWADAAAREYQGGLSRLRTGAIADVNKALFSYQGTRADAVVGKVIAYHYWNTRAGALYIGSAMRHPGMISGYFRAMEGMEKEAEAQGYPPTMMGFMRMMNSDLGMSLFFQPAGVIMAWGLFASEQEREDQNALERAINNKWAPGMLQPLIGMALSYLGGTPSTTAFDPSGTRPIRQLTGAIVHQMRSNGQLEWLPEGAPFEHILQVVREQGSRFGSWVIPGAEYVPAGTGDEGMEWQIAQMVEALAVETYGDSREADVAVMRALGDTSDPLYQEAYSRWADQNLMLRAGQVVSPVMIRSSVTYGDATRAENRRYQRIEDAGGTLTVLQQLERDQNRHDGTIANAGSSQARAIYAADRTWDTMLTPDEERARDINSTLIYGNAESLTTMFPQGITYGGQVYTVEQWVAAGEDARKAATSGIMMEIGGQPYLDSYYDKRAQMEATDPGFAQVTAYRDRVRSEAHTMFGGNVIAWADATARANPNFERWWNDAKERADGNLDILESSINSANGYMAFAGIEASRWDPPLAVARPEAVPASAGGLAGIPSAAGTGGGSAPVDRRATMYEQITEYNTQVSQTNAFLSRVAGSPINYATLIPPAREAADNMLRTAGIDTPYAGHELEAYMALYGSGVLQTHAFGSPESIDYYLQLTTDPAQPDPMMLSTNDGTLTPAPTPNYVLGGRP